MRTLEEKQTLSERAAELRRAGKSVREIKEILGPVGKRALHEALKDVPPQEWTKRPNAKDDLREKARQLRLQGLTYDEIVAQLADLILRVYIHESADVTMAERYWIDLTGVQPGQLRRATLKRHNPKTVRKNTGEGYRGCLRVDVRKSAGLYRKIKGWASAVMAA